MTRNGVFKAIAVAALAGAAALNTGATFARDKKSSDTPDTVRTVTVTVDAKGEAPRVDPSDFAVYKGDTKQQIVDVKGPSETPVNVAILIQDGLDQGVGHELDTIRDFVAHLPAGSQVMVGYLRGTGLHVVRPFTTDLADAAKAVRLPFSSLDEGSAPFIGLVDALGRFETLEGRNQVVMISNGLELNRDLSSASPSNNIDLDRAVAKAQRLGIPVWGIFANSPGSFGRSRLAVMYGQGSLNRASDETGGRAFFAGNGFVTFDHALERISEGIQNQYLIAYRGTGKGDLDVTVESSGVKILHAK
jgi:hypothetical protein